MERRVFVKSALASASAAALSIDGQTQTPDFRLDSSHKGTGLLLTTKFHAIVDGTSTSGGASAVLAFGMPGQARLL